MRGDASRITYTITPEMLGEGVLAFREAWNCVEQQAQRLVLDTQDKAVHAALVALGWMPPESTPRVWDAESIKDAPERGWYILADAYSDDWKEAEYTEYYDMGGSSEKEVYQSAKLFTKAEVLAAIEPVTEYGTRGIAYGPIPLPTPYLQRDPKPEAPKKGEE